MVLGLAATCVANGPKIFDEVKQNVKDRVDNEYTPGIVIGLIDPTGTTFFSYGRRSDDGDPINADTVFEIGSVTKVFTGILLADLVEKGKVSLDEAYGRVRNDEVWLMGCDIAEYRQANVLNHEPRRPRKLLLHRQEINRLEHKITEKGLTLIPLTVYFRRGRAKVELALARGKHRHDKRETIKRREGDREARRAMRR